ncbi:cellular retinoic acid-binding protein 1 isoform X1 [Amblyraja radiata]|uniref:cellular retinoic acid-binding protein 1 isoform X1 n=1 Tax=Amblyraja radiata TaxID=386614 RepID=UPI001402D164|nr:cellular retinoic acid-binding protein 1 isoform X1 [Amblyraja radiata]
MRPGWRQPPPLWTAGSLWAERPLPALPFAFPPQTIAQTRLLSIDCIYTHAATARPTIISRAANIGVNAMLRKVAGAAASKPLVEIRQDGDHFYIKTSTTVRTTEITFTVGEEFEEETVDGRKCKSLPKWENENKIYCKQTLLSGSGPKTHWTRELKNNELILTLVANEVVCTRIYVKE